MEGMVPRRTYQQDDSSSTSDATSDTEGEPTSGGDDSGNDPGGYLSVTGDSLPRIAELYGHAGEWLALLGANEQLTDYNNISPGTPINIPDEWQESSTPEDTEAGDSGGTTSSDDQTETTTETDAPNYTAY